VTAQEIAQDKLRRRDLYKEFIEDASKTYADGLQNGKPDASALVEIYTKISRMRVISSPKVVDAAEQVARAIVDAYSAPNVTVSELRDLMDKGRLDPLRVFSEGCRAEFVGRFAPIEAASVGKMEAWLEAASTSSVPNSAPTSMMWWCSMTAAQWSLVLRSRTPR
jgi:hypothetical protein